jgi:hypothetical protein
MNYSKPEVNTLGEAKSVIERTGKAAPVAIDPPLNNKTPNPAYDLDE